MKPELAGGGMIRHHCESWFAELLAGFTIDETVGLDGRTMNGNPARLLQIWARRNAWPGGEPRG